MAIEAVQDETLEASTASGIQDETLERGPVTVGSESEETRMRRIVRAAVINNTTDKAPFVEVLNKAIFSNRELTGEEILNQAADSQRESNRNQVFETFLQDAIGGADLDVVDAQINEARTQDMELAADPVRGTKQYVTTMVHPPLTEQARLDLEVNLEILDKIAPIVESITGLETAFDIAMAFIPPVTLVDNGQLTGAFTDLLENKHTLSRALGYFRALSPEEKRKQFPVFLEMSKELRRPRQVQFLTALVDPTFEADARAPFEFWTLIETATLASGLVSKFFSLRKRYNAIKAAAEAGDTDLAADINMVLLQASDDALGDVLDIPRLTAMDNVSPFKADEYNAAAESLISPGTHERIFAFRDKVKRIFTDLSEGKSFARESILTDQTQIDRATRRLTAEYEVYVAQRFQGRDKIVELVEISDNPRGVNFEFKVTNADGTVIKDVYRGQFVRDDIGMYQNLGTGSVWRSEKAQAAKTDFFGTVLSAIRLDNTSANVATQLRNLTKEASKSIRRLKGESKIGQLRKRKQRIKDVDQILSIGDDIPGGKVFTPDELKAGVSGIKLDDDQIEYYYNMRGIMSNLGILRNMDIRADMLQRGVKEIFFRSGKLGFGEVIEDVEIARRRLGGSLGNIDSVWFQTGGGASRAFKVRDLNIDEAYAQGFRLVRLEDDIIFGGSGRFRHTLVHTDRIRPLPALVVDLKVGYVPRINPKAVWFVQAFSPSHLDGVKDLSRKAVRSFDNKKEAQQFLREFDLVKDLDPRFSSETKLFVVADHELEAFRAGDTGLSSVNGLIHSPRARIPVPHGKDGTIDNVPRLGALESIELYLQNTTSFLTRNEWRMGVQTRWENTARYMKPGNKDITFAKPGDALLDPELANAHKKISSFSGFMDKSERIWEQRVRGVLEWSIENIGRGRITDLLLKARRQDPLAGIRALTFHNLLGMFNPIQLWVQAQGAAVAFAMNIFDPVTFQKVFRQMHSMALIQHIKPGMMTPGALNKLAKFTGFKNAEEMLATKKLWDKSGLYQSVLSSADVEAAARGFPTTMGSLKRFADSGLMFFRTGELFNRRMGFLTAMIEQGGVVKIAKSDRLFKKVMDRSNDLILNLGKANRASWQKGLLSIPTQFMQIQFKTIESILGLNGAFTKMERVKLLTAQTALYGTAGVYGGNWIARNFLNAIGMDQEAIDNADPQYVKLLSGGMTDWLAYHMGADITAADRGALLNGFDQVAYSFLTSESTLFEWMAGPSGVLPTRMQDAYKKLQPWMARPRDINGRTNVRAQDISDVLRRTGTDIIGLAVSPFAITSQIAKAWLMHDLGAIRDKNGNIIAQPEGGFNWQTEWAAVIGFKPEALQRKFDLSEMNQARRDYVELRSNMLLIQFDKYLMAIERSRVRGVPLTVEEISQYDTDRTVLEETIRPDARDEVLQSFRARLVDRETGGSQFQRQQREYWEKNFTFPLADSLLDQLRGRGITTGGTRIIQVNPPKQEQEQN